MQRQISSPRIHGNTSSKHDPSIRPFSLAYMFIPREFIGEKKLFCVIDEVLYIVMPHGTRTITYIFFSNVLDGK